MFDPTSEQTVTTRLKGKQVRHVFKPISDADFLTFLDRREKLDEDEALSLFYDLFVDRLEGITGALPANWKELLPAAEKRDVAKKTILHAQFIQPDELEVVDEDGLSFSDYLAVDRNERTYTLQSYWNGEKYASTHTLRLFTAKERKDLVRVLSSEANTERFKVEYAASLFIRAFVHDRGYKPDQQTPLIHQSAVVVQHLTSDSLVIEKLGALRRAVIDQVKRLWQASQPSGSLCPGETDCPDFAAAGGEGISYEEQCHACATCPKKKASWSPIGAICCCDLLSGCNSSRGVVIPAIP